MPYTHSDFPESWKNVPAAVRNKAVDIWNALNREGMPEDQSYAIALGQAKKWHANHSSGVDMSKTAAQVLKMTPELKAYEQELSPRLSAYLRQKYPDIPDIGGGMRGAFKTWAVSQPKTRLKEMIVECKKFFDQEVVDLMNQAKATKNNLGLQNRLMEKRFIVKNYATETANMLSHIDFAERLQQDIASDPLLQNPYAKQMLSEMMKYRRSSFWKRAEKNESAIQELVELASRQAANDEGHNSDYPLIDAYIDRSASNRAQADEAKAYLRSHKGSLVVKQASEIKKTLCAWCHRLKDMQSGDWTNEVDNTPCSCEEPGTVSHGMCPTCKKNADQELAELLAARPHGSKVWNRAKRALAEWEPKSVDDTFVPAGTEVIVNEHLPLYDEFAGETKQDADLKSPEMVPVEDGNTKSTVSVMARDLDPVLKSAAVWNRAFKIACKTAGAMKSLYMFLEDYGGQELPTVEMIQKLKAYVQGDAHSQEVVSYLLEQGAIEARAGDKYFIRPVESDTSDWEEEPAVHSADGANFMTNRPVDEDPDQAKMEGYSAFRGGSVKQASAKTAENAGQLALREVNNKAREIYHILKDIDPEDIHPEVHAGMMKLAQDLFTASKMHMAARRVVAMANGEHLEQEYRNQMAIVKKMEKKSGHGTVSLSPEDKKTLLDARLRARDLQQMMRKKTSRIWRLAAIPNSPKEKKFWLMDIPLRGALADIPGRLEMDGQGYQAYVEVMGHTVKAWELRMIDAQRAVTEKVKDLVHEMGWDKAPERGGGFGEHTEPALSFPSAWQK